MRKYFLGLAAHFNGLDILKHTLAFGTKKDFERLKKNLARHYHTKADQVLLYHNGRSALSAGIKIFLPPGSKVGVNAFTCYAVIEAITAASCIPVFLDIDSKTLHFNGQTLKRAFDLHPDLKAVIVQNSLGIPCDLPSIKSFADRKHLLIFEDLAHSAGIDYQQGLEAGSVGVFSALSFGKGKAYDTSSGGALILPDDPSLFSYYQKPVNPDKRPPLKDTFRDRFYPLFGRLIRGFYYLHLGKILTDFLVKTHLIQRSADATLSFTNRLTYWQARLMLKRLKKFPKHRPPIRKFALVNYRERVLVLLERSGYFFQDFWYECPVSPKRYFKKVHFETEECPVATDVAKKIINLPIHYPESKLVKARQIIKPYLTKGLDEK